MNVHALVTSVQILEEEDTQARLHLYTEISLAT